MSSLYNDILVPDDPREDKKSSDISAGSLYRGLYDDSEATISKEPVKYEADPSASVLRFKPTGSRVRKKGTPSSGKSNNPASIHSINNKGVVANLSSDITTNRRYAPQQETQYWDLEYDPLMPNSYHDYINSEENLAEIEDWMDYLEQWKNELDKGNIAVELSGPVAFSKASSKSYEESDMVHVPGDFEELSENTFEKTGKSQRVGAKLLQKYGWKQGKGLGVSEDGIVNALRFAVNKKRPGSGKIIDKNSQSRQKIKSDTSRVVVFKGILNTPDYSHIPLEEIPSIIGAKCQEDYGDVIRVYIDTPNVFVKFQNELSSLRAVNDLRVLVSGIFYDEDEFENGNFSI